MAANQPSSEDLLSPAGGGLKGLPRAPAPQPKNHQPALRPEDRIKSGPQAESLPHIEPLYYYSMPNASSTLPELAPVTA
jgi:hypothetical protein